jgi:hypothetical protein
MKPTVLELQNFRIQYGNEWITISIKFSGHQTFALKYPAALQPNVARYWEGFFKHIMQAEYFWLMQANCTFKETHEGTVARILSKRANTCMQLTEQYLRQLCEMEEDT